MKYVSIVFPLTSLRLQCQWKNNWSMSMPGSWSLRKNLPTKNQLTVQMTWQEGKSEGFREILRYDKRNRNAIYGSWTSIKCWNVVENIHLEKRSSNPLGYFQNLWLNSSYSRHYPKHVQHLCQVILFFFFFSSGWIL